jgi:hypothetical protein
MIKSGRGLLYISIAVLCGFSLLVACNDADGAADARLTGGTGGEGATRGAGAAGGGAGAQALEPLTFKVEGTVCGEQVDYEAPADAVLTLVLTPSGRLQGLLIGDGPLIDINDVDAMRTYAEHHDVIANIGLEETAVLRVGSVGWASGGLSARGWLSQAERHRRKVAGNQRVRTRHAHRRQHDARRRLVLRHLPRARGPQLYGGRGHVVFQWRFRPLGRASRLLFADSKSRAHFERFRARLPVQPRCRQADLRPRLLGSR